MTARRRLAVTLTALAAAGALTGCERPAPIVTVVSGTNSEWKEADVYCFEGQSFANDDCAVRADEPVRIPVVPGEQVGVDVSKHVVERGWFVELTGPDGQPQQGPVQEDRHWFAFTAPNVGPDGLRLVVRALGEEGPQGEPSGEWTFDLVPRD
jgi:hypothetical protein